MDRRNVGASRSEPFMGGERVNLVSDRGFGEVLSAAQNLLALGIILYALGEDRNERGRERVGREQPQRREQRPEWRGEPILRPFDGYNFDLRKAGGDPGAPGGRTAFRKPHVILDQIDYKNHSETVSKM